MRDIFCLFVQNTLSCFRNKRKNSNKQSFYQSRKNESRKDQPLTPEDIKAKAELVLCFPGKYLHGRVSFMAAKRQNTLHNWDHEERGEIL